MPMMAKTWAKVEKVKFPVPFKILLTLLFQNTPPISWGREAKAIPNEAGIMRAQPAPKRR